MRRSDLKILVYCGEESTASGGAYRQSIAAIPSRTTGRGRFLAPLGMTVIMIASGNDRRFVRGAKIGAGDVESPAPTSSLDFRTQSLEVFQHQIEPHKSTCHNICGSYRNRPGANLLPQSTGATTVTNNLILRARPHIPTDTAGRRTQPFVVCESRRPMVRKTHTPAIRAGLSRQRCEPQPPNARKPVRDFASGWRCPGRYRINKNWHAQWFSQKGFRARNICRDRRTNHWHFSECG